jgi:uncharacterized protein YdeI (YjbR/CyaY-like superfamily)
MMDELGYDLELTYKKKQPTKAAENRDLTMYEAMRENVLPVKNRIEFRQWLTLHASKETECWITVKRGKPIDPDVFYYLDAVEEALCFGWIDSTHAVITA